MRKLAFVTGVLSVLALFCTVDSFAQGGPGYRWRGSGGWGMGGAYNRLWEQSKIETVSGTVEAIETVVPMKGMHQGIVVILRTPKETIPVHLGPQWYIERLDLKLQKGDSVEVRGSRVTFRGKPAIIAGQIKKGNESVTLRNDSGIPAWAGWRRG